VRGEYLESGVCLGLGIATKTWPALLIVPTAQRIPRERRLRFLVVTLAPPILISAPFLLRSQYFMPSVMSPAGLSLATLLFASAYVVFLLLHLWRATPLLDAATIIISAFLLVMPKHIQYYLWLLPYLLMQYSEGSKAQGPAIGIACLGYSLDRYKNTLSKILKVPTSTIEPIPQLFITMAVAGIAISLAVSLYGLRRYLAKRPTSIAAST
jgi:hypothetical protein